MLDTRTRFAPVHPTRRANRTMDCDEWRHSRHAPLHSTRAACAAPLALLLLHSLSLVDSACRQQIRDIGWRGKSGQGSESKGGYATRVSQVSDARGDCCAAMTYNPATHDVHIMAKTLKEVSVFVQRRESGRGGGGRRGGVGRGAPGGAGGP